MLAVLEHVETNKVELHLKNLKEFLKKTEKLF